MIFGILTVLTLTEKTTMENLLAGFFRFVFVILNFFSPFLSFDTLVKRQYSILNRPAGEGRWMTMKRNGSADSFPVSFCRYFFYYY